MNINEIKNKLLPISGNRRTKFFSELKYYVYVYCEITDDNKRLPIYIGKGKSDRFFSHLNNLENENSKKNKKIIDLIKDNKLGIDIIAYGLDNDTALSVESACIDLMGIGNLANIVRGHGDNIKRVSLKELTSLITNETVKVKKEHRGVSILINRDYKPTFGDLELFEITRGIWSKKMVSISKDAIYAYATFKGVVKEVYEIHSWVPAGTQEYFTRNLTPERLASARWEFVGRKAPEDIRSLYVGNIIEKQRSYGDPFIKVGFD